MIFTFLLIFCKLKITLYWIFLINLRTNLCSIFFLASFHFQNTNFLNFKHFLLACGNRALTARSALSTNFGASAYKLHEIVYPCLPS